MNTALVNFLVLALVLGFLACLFFWVLGQYDVPQPIDKLIRVRVVVIVALVLVLMLFDLIDAPVAGLDLPLPACRTAIAGSPRRAPAASHWQLARSIER